jgi:AcrR family transcriptional regulator
MPRTNTREKLLRSAVDLFYKKGYADTSIRQIGAKAGITTSLVYHYFKNKEDMLFEILQNISKQLCAALKEVEERTTDPMECLREMIVVHTAIELDRNKKASKILVEEVYWIRGKKKKIITEKQREIYDLYMQKLEELQEKDLLGDVDLTVLNFSIFGIINWFFRWYREGGRLSKEEVADNIWKIVFHGMLKPRPCDMVSDA